MEAITTLPKFSLAIIRKKGTNANHARKDIPGVGKAKISNNEDKKHKTGQ